MESYQIPELPLWLEESPHPATLFEKFVARYWGDVKFFWGKLFGCKEYGMVYLIWNNEKKRYYVDLRHGFAPFYNYYPPKD